MSLEHYSRSVVGMSRQRQREKERGREDPLLFDKKGSRVHFFLSFSLDGDRRCESLHLGVANCRTRTSNDDRGLLRRSIAEICVNNTEGKRIRAMRTRREGNQQIRSLPIGGIRFLVLFQRFHVALPRRRGRRGRSRAAPDRSIRVYSHEATTKNEAEGGFRSGPTGSVSLSASIGHINHIANDAAPLFIYSPSLFRWLSSSASISSSPHNSARSIFVA